MGDNSDNPFKAGPHALIPQEVNETARLYKKPNGRKNGNEQYKRR